MISKLHYISQGSTHAAHLSNIQRMCDAGANWIQLRIKDESLNTILETAYKAKEICNNYKAQLIINDHFKIANQVDAHGVHLGKQDACPLEARKVLGENKIIGGTANTLEDCIDLYTKKVDYIGLGPLKFTSTKKNLSPILGIEGYQQILKQLQTQFVTIPVIAIGGVGTQDLNLLANCGLYGVAVSGWLTNAKNPAAIFEDIYQQFSELKI